MFFHGRVSVLLMILWLSCLGCGPQPNPGTWDQAKVEAKIKESLKLSEIALQPSTGGGYTGSGKNAEGETYKLTVKQEPANKRLTWNFQGDRGDVGENHYEFVNAQ